MTALNLCYSLPRGCDCVHVGLLPQYEIEVVASEYFSCSQ